MILNLSLIVYNIVVGDDHKFIINQALYHYKKIMWRKDTLSLAQFSS